MGLLEKVMRSHFSFFFSFTLSHHTSLVIPSNELLNVWTHLIGAIWALYTLIWINFSDTVPAYYDRIDIALSSIYLCCILVCMVLSSTYHLLCCISESHYHYWLKWDLFGIVIVGGVARTSC